MSKCDPEASHSILSNPILIPKTILITIDLTHQVLATPAVQARILTAAVTDPASSPSILRKILHALLNFFGGTYKTVFGLESGPPLHDPLAVAVILSNLNPTFANAAMTPSSRGVLQFDDKSGERFSVTVVTDGQHGQDVSIAGQLGRTIARPVVEKEAKRTSGITIPRAVDVDAFWDLIMDCIELAEMRTAVPSPPATVTATVISS
jgi:uridine nucleosidase